VGRAGWDEGAVPLLMDSRVALRPHAPGKYRADEQPFSYSAATCRPAIVAALAAPSASLAALSLEPGGGGGGGKARGARAKAGGGGGMGLVPSSLEPPLAAAICVGLRRT
jgi:hypothetical protein